MLLDLTVDCVFMGNNKKCCLLKWVSDPHSMYECGRVHVSKFDSGLHLRMVHKRVTRIHTHTYMCITDKYVCFLKLDKLCCLLSSAAKPRNFVSWGESKAVAIANVDIITRKKK